MKQIREFIIEDDFLSNEYLDWIDIEIDYCTETYPCVYQAYYAKQLPSWTYRCVLSTDIFPVDAVSLYFNRVPNEFKNILNDNSKLRIMELLLLNKFSLSREGRQGTGENLGRRLLSTGYSELINGTFIPDEETYFWGVDLNTGKGNNFLGRLLMQIRHELRSQK